LVDIVATAKNRPSHNVKRLSSGSAGGLSKKTYVGVDCVFPPSAITKIDRDMIACNQLLA
jgi:hypothetical protein